MWSPPTPLHTQERHPAEPKGEPAQYAPKKTNAQDARLEDGESEMPSDGIEVFEAVSLGNEDGEDDPSDEGDYEPVACCARWVSLAYK